ncbi:MAG: class I SAM-dependent methyltransferase [Cyanobacteria bacterium]|nr:class I SAM-dependent methyltransferase [Cyanobacteriota bacterium]MDW8201264.1 hypothetical protein [Cyanobacteriota bacterium SKYGB_h_bin112]
MLKSLIALVKQWLFPTLGISLRRYDGVESSSADIGRRYCDPPHVRPHFALKPLANTSYSNSITLFTVTTDQGTLEQVVYYGHLALVTLCKHFTFHTVLDIGSCEQNASRIFRHLGKHTTTVEILPGYEADYHADYLSVTLPQPMDAIWCSHVLEHQRNPGLFLDKVYDDLKEGGILALTVPYQVDSSLCLGHCNLFSPLLLLYHLICAGFDCRQASLRVYNGQISVLLKKVPNTLKRRASFAYMPSPANQYVDTIDYAPELLTYFPVAISGTIHRQPIQAINWPK